MKQWLVSWAVNTVLIAFFLVFVGCGVWVLGCTLALLDNYLGAWGMIGFVFLSFTAMYTQIFFNPNDKVGR